MFQYTQLRKEVRLMDGQTSVAPVLMRFQRGCQQVGDFNLNQIGQRVILSNRTIKLIGQMRTLLIPPNKI